MYGAREEKRRASDGYEFSTPRNRSDGGGRDQRGDHENPNERRSKKIRNFSTKKNHGWSPQLGEVLHNFPTEDRIKKKSREK